MNGPHSMTKWQSPISGRFVFALSILAAFLSYNSLLSVNTAWAQTSRPVLFSDAESTRAVVVESVINKREPFSAVATVSFATDNRTRIMLLAGNLQLAQGEATDQVTADAE